MNTRRALSTTLMAGGIVMALAAVALSMATGTSAAPDLVANGHFDTDTANWTAQSDTTINHVASEDANLSPTSGALGLVDDGSVANDAIVTSDCIVLTGPGSYEIHASYKSASTAGGTERGQVIVTVFDDVACSVNAVAHPSGQLDPNSAGWLAFSGNVIVGAELSAIVELTDEGATDVDDQIYWDKVSLSEGPLDTPTPAPTNTVGPTNTPAPTNTPGPTNTPAPTNTPSGTDTPEPTETPTETPVPADTPTNTPVPPTSTPVPPTATKTTAAKPPAAAIDEPSGGAGAGGEVPEDAVGSGEEQPEDAANLADLGHGPQPVQSHATKADAAATLAFGAAMVMLTTGFWLRRRNHEQAE